MKKLTVVVLIMLAGVLFFGRWVVTAPSAVKPIKLTFAIQDPESSWQSVEGDIPWIKAVEKATMGQVVIEPYFAQTLVKGKDAFDAVKTGVCDIGWCVMGYWPGLTPLTEVITLPFLPFKSGEQGSSVLWQLYERFPELQKEFADVKVLKLWTTDPNFLMTTKKQVKTLEDLKGLKIRVLGGPPIESLKALGAVPTLVPMPDLYLALERGTLDGAGLMFPAGLPFRIHEVVKYYTHVPLYMTFFSVIMKLDKWNSLPADIQKQIMSVSGFWGSTLQGYRVMDRAEEVYRERALKDGYKMVEYVLPPEEVERWRKIGGVPLWEAWVKKQEAAGRPRAREILNTTLDLIKEYKPIHSK